MDHIFVLNPDYQGNIFLGYDRENNTIQSHADKKRIWKAIDDGDETQRLQTPESEVEGIARPSAPAIQILIKETPEFSQVAKERIKEYRKDHHLPEITLERSDAEKTVAQKRNEKLFYRISDMVLDKLQTLPKDVLIQEIDKAISILLRPIGYKWRNKHHRNYYLKAFKGKL